VIAPDISYAFSSNNIPDNIIKDYNKKCLLSSEEGINKNRWSEYCVHQNKGINQDPILIIPIIIISSIFIILIGEGPFYNFQINSEANLTSFTLLISSMFRGITSFFIIRFLIKRFKSFFAEEVFPSSPLNYGSFPKYRKKLLASAGIMSFPSFLISTYFSSFIMSDSEFEGFSSSVFSLMMVAIDLSRMFLCIWLIRHKRRRTKLNIMAKWYRSSTITSILAGILHFMFAIISQGMIYQVFYYFGIGSLSQYVSLGIVLIGIIQIIWAVLMRKRRGRTLRLVGLSGGIVLTALWIIISAAMPIIQDKIDSEKNYIDFESNFYYNLSSLSWFIIFAGILITTIQIAYISLTTMIIVKEKQNEAQQIEKISPMKNK
jgi:hypothetical protein